MRVEEQYRGSFQDLVDTLDDETRALLELGWRVHAIDGDPHSAAVLAEELTGWLTPRRGHFWNYYWAATFDIDGQTEQLTVRLMDRDDNELHKVTLDPAV